MWVLHLGTRGRGRKRTRCTSATYEHYGKSDCRRHARASTKRLIHSRALFHSSLTRVLIGRKRVVVRPRVWIRIAWSKAVGVGRLKFIREPLIICAAGVLVERVRRIVRTVVHAEV